MAINTNNNSFSFISGLLTTVPFGLNYFSSVLNFDNKIYFGRNINTSFFTEFDFTNNSTRIFTRSIVSPESPFESSVGLCLAFDNKIYSVTGSLRNVYVLNTLTKQINLINVAPGQQKSFGGVLAPNGVVYEIPFRVNGVLTGVNSITNQVDFTSSALITSALDKWAGGVLAPNGNIYCIPHNATTVLKINTNVKFNFPEEVLLSPYLNKL